ncbi:oligopeptide/dipeptide ABC transporter ATP-binding protein [Mumia zhuanghuii]|uniref:oligopeptide/dipeptide ABC transporter ATP-binding protein n=1 Tax=Mumia zhuanghuii TaxID=2585211 RepID=UPI00363D90B5
MSAQTAPLVEVEGLVKHYRLSGKRARGAEVEVVHAVDGVDLQVKKGGALALVGESGCGKSTIAKALVGLVEPTSGRVRIGGHDVVPVTRNDLAARRRVQLVSQNPWSALNRARSLRHILAQPVRLHGGVSDRAAVNQRCTELLAMVGLPTDYLSRRPRDLSGGELQRVTIARALATGPDVLVLDEPTASLDVSVKATIVNLLADLRVELDLTYVLITHELDIARHVADDVAVMYLGEVVESGPIEKVFTAPEHPYSRALLDAAPTELVVGRLSGGGLTGEVPSAIDVPTGCRFHTRCPVAVDDCSHESPALRGRPEGRAAACLRLDELLGDISSSTMTGRNPA